MITIRKAEIGDLFSVVKIFEQYRDFYRCEKNEELAIEFISNRIESKDSVILIAVNESQSEPLIVGFTQLYPLYSSTAMKKLWLLNDLFVMDKFRGNGIADELIESSKKIARSSGARGLFLETESTNEIAQALYKKTGFIKNENIFYNFEL